MRLKTLTKKISFAIPAKIIASIAVVMVIMCVGLAITLSSMSNRLIERQVEFLADKNASTASEYLEAMQAQSKALSSEVSRYHSLYENTAESLIKKTLTAILDDDRIFSAYAAFEPNAYFKKTDNGLSYYAYRDGDSIAMDVNNDYDIYNTGDYYAVTKETLSAHITEPYSYQLSNGETVWLISISNPVFDESGDFIGVTNCDVLVDTLNNLSYDLNDYGTAFSYILTDNGTYVAHTADKTLFGTALEDDAHTNIMDAVSNGKELQLEGQNQIHGGTAFEVYVPLTIEGISQNWSSAFVVNKSEALASTNLVVIIVVLLALAGLVVLSVIAAFLLKKALRPVDSIVAFANELGKGNLTADITVSADNELGDIASSLKNTAVTLSSYVNEISVVLNEISHCNLDVSVERDYVGDFSPIKAALTEILCSMNDTMEQIELSSSQVSVGAAQVASGAQALSQGTTEQAAAIEELSASIHEVSDGVSSNADNVHAATGYVEDASTGLEASNNYMAQLLSSMDEINQSSEQISKIIKVIDDIAFQTNILALNAAVEAARAGSAGKGFAVVAEEVRNLASKSAEAAKQTSALIEGSLKAVSDGSAIAANTATSLELVLEKAMRVDSAIRKIDQASSAQALAISQITQGLSQVSVVIQTNSATAEESAAASEELSSQSELLHGEVSKFKLRSTHMNQL